MRCGRVIGNGIGNRIGNRIGNGIGYGVHLACVDDEHCPAALEGERGTGAAQR